MTPAPATSSRKATGHATPTQPVRQDNVQEPRKTEKKCELCGKMGALNCLMSKEDPTLCISCSATQFRAENAPNRECNTDSIDTYVPESLNEAIY